MLYHHCCPREKASQRKRRSVPLFSPLKTNLLRAKGEVGPGSPKRMLGSGALRATPPPRLQGSRWPVRAEVRREERRVAQEIRSGRKD